MTIEDAYAKVEQARTRYQKSEKGRIARKRYLESEKGKAAKKRYLESEKGKEALLRYNLSDKAKTVKQRRLILSKLSTKAMKYLEANPNKTVEDYISEVILMEENWIISSAGEE